MTSLDLRSPPFVLLDDSRAPHQAGTSLLFHSPDHIITANSFDEIPAALSALDEAYKNGFYTAGWISYEVATAFEERIAKRLTRKADEPLIWMIATKHCEQLTPQDLETCFHNAARGNRRLAEIEIGAPEQSQEEYLAAIAQVQDYIQAGDVYQINHTFPLPVKVTGDALALYQKLRSNQPVPYGAFIDTGETKILSLSPELFLEKSGETLRAKPMKGTAPRGANADEDSTASSFLKQDEKSRAENLMIVDLIRNDLSRIAAPGSVKVTGLFETEKYPTLFQMTSTVEAKAPEGLVPSKLLESMFPCGSITGAPKVRAMEIINELETAPRGIYCGTIGHFSPPAQLRTDHWALNVPIRTICLQKDGAGRLNIGSGIVADSDPKAEYAECLLKSQFVRSHRPSFSLIETLRLEEGRYKYLDRHLDRLASSASYFDFKYDRAKITMCLTEHAEAVSSSFAQRCRLLLDKLGHCTITSQPLPDKSYWSSNQYDTIHDMKLAGTVTLSPLRVESNDTFLRHKTTLRSMYDEAFERATENGHLDILFCNEEGHVTEGAISNIYIVKNGKLITPPETDGLLPGIQRSEALASIPSHILEVRSIKVDEVQDADMLLIGNAVRGLRYVQLISTAN